MPHTDIQRSNAFTRWALRTCFFVAFASAAIPAKAQSEPDQTVPAHVKEANANYENGVRHLNSGLHATALELFQRSQALDPHPRTTFMMAVLESGIGHNARARRLLYKALAESAKLDEETRKSATELLERVNARLCRFQVTVSERNAIVLVDGRPLEHDNVPKASFLANPVFVAGISEETQVRAFGVDKFEILVDPGIHRIELSAVGFYTETIERAIDARESIVINVSLTRSFWRKASAGLTVIGGVGFALGLGTFLYAAQATEAARMNCSAEWVCSEEGRRQYNNAQRAAKVSTFLVPISLAFAVPGTIYWLATYRETEKKDELPQIAKTFSASIGVGHHEGMLLVTGSF
jgi:hypothetical protein